ncbi:MAG TPA: hypothetical protein VN612_14495 [Acidobacteriaceae bacterium]|nr:hypothetical protein [Acidobacteriaceae bacterium]
MLNANALEFLFAYCIMMFFTLLGGGAVAAISLRVPPEHPNSTRPGMIALLTSIACAVLSGALGSAGYTDELDHPSGFYIYFAFVLAAVVSMWVATFGNISMRTDRRKLIRWVAILLALIDTFCVIVMIASEASLRASHL